MSSGCPASDAAPCQCKWEAVDGGTNTEVPATHVKTRTECPTPGFSTVKPQLFAAIEKWTSRWEIASPVRGPVVRWPFEMFTLHIRVLCLSPASPLWIPALGDSRGWLSVWVPTTQGGNMAWVLTPGPAWLFQPRLSQAFGEQTSRLKIFLQPSMSLCLSNAMKKKKRQKLRNNDFHGNDDLPST